MHLSQIHIGSAVRSPVGTVGLRPQSLQIVEFAHSGLNTCTITSPESISTQSQLGKALDVDTLDSGFLENLWRRFSAIAPRAGWPGPR